MANVADTVAVPGSNIKTGDGTNSRTFTLPGSPGMKIQSVVATVDNTAGADTTATLTIKDQSGEVIATQRQDDVIPAADTGTATFALRLPGSKGGNIRFSRDPQSGRYLLIETTGIDPASGYGQAYKLAANTKLVILDRNDAIVLEVDENDGFTYTTQQSNNLQLLMGSSGVTYVMQGGAGFAVFADGQAQLSSATSNTTINSATNTTIASSGDVIISPGGKLAFFGVSGATQQATPVTLGDVIALLRAYGLAA